MKLKRILSLSFREFYLARKKIIGSLIVLVSMTVIALLILLSLDYGNLKLIVNDFGADAQQADFPEQLKKFIGFSVQLYPIFTSCFIVVSVAENCHLDERTVWQNFYRTLPATPAEKSAATFLLIIILDVIGLMSSFGIVCLVSAMTGSEITSGLIGLITACAAIGNLLAAIEIVCIKLFHSADKAGLVLVGVCFVSIIGGTAIYNIFFARPAPPHDPDAGIPTFMENIQAVIDNFLSIGKTVFPIALVVSAASLIIGFTLCYAIYKRRDK